VAVIEVQESYLVHAALDERGDMVVIAADGSQLDYREFKKRIGGMRLAFPSCDVVRVTPDFQIWSFQRTENNSSLWLCRSMISGKSGDNRPMPIFEVYRGSCKTPRSAAPDGLRAGVFVSEPSRTASGQA